MNEIIKTINEKRQTVKKYSDKKIPDEDWRQILETVYWSPSSHGFEPYRVLVINKENPIRSELIDMMWGQKVVVEADKIMFFITLDSTVFGSDEFIKERSIRKLTKIMGKSQQEAEEQSKNIVKVIKTHLKYEIDEQGDAWPMKQSYIALGQAMSAATILGIGTTPMEGIDKSNMEAFFKKKELMKSNERLSVALTFGYPNDETAYAHHGSGKRVRDAWSKKIKEI